MNPLHWHLKVLVLVLVSVTTSVLNAEELRFTIKRLAIDTNECAAVADYIASAIDDPATIGAEPVLAN